jgi:hypothetical protein
MNKSFVLGYCYRFKGAGGVNEALRRNMKRFVAFALGAAISFASWQVLSSRPTRAQLQKGGAKQGKQGRFAHADE